MSSLRKGDRSLLFACRVKANTRSRKFSASSHVDSIAHVNSAARWGGYSPNGYITSLAGSIRSVSWSQASIRDSSSIRKHSATQLTKPESENPPLDVPTASPNLEILLSGDSLEASFLKHFEGIDRCLKQGVGSSIGPHHPAESRGVQLGPARNYLGTARKVEHS